MRGALLDKEQITSFIQAAQQGDEQAFTALVRAWQDVAVAYAASILRDYHLAEDAAQEAFVEAYRELPNLREPAAFNAWLRTILFKHCDRLTRRKKHPTTMLEAAYAVADVTPTPHEELEQRENTKALWQAITALPETERTVVLLYYMGEHSTALIAEFLQITANAVKTRLYAARKRLRKFMAELENNLQAARPSGNAAFAEKVVRLIQPEALKKNAPLFWSPGMGSDLWKMFCACITGDLATVQRLLQQDPSLARAQYEYRTPLSFAVRENQLAVAAYLLDHGATFAFGNVLEMAQDRGYTEMQKLLEAKLSGVKNVAPRGAPVAAAIRARDLAEVRRLLDADPTLVHASDEHTNQPMHWAVMTRQLDMIDELLARGADINAQRGDGARPMQLTNGDYDFRGWREVPSDWPTTPSDVRMHLRARGADVDICTACFIGDLERVRELLQQDPTLANRPSDYVTYYACSGTPLRNAATAGHLEIVKLLLAHGADPNLPEEHIAPRGHALHSAVCNGHIEIVKLLLEHGAYPNVEVESSADTLSAALAAAGYSTERNQEMVDLLCSYGAARAVHLLAYSNDLQTAAAVFAANPALADDTEALANAAANGHEGFVRLLLRYRPDLPQRRAIGGKTPVITALLFQHGMNPNHPNWLRITPLHYFAEAGDLQNAAMFIAHGAEVNAGEEELRSTPLGWAARCGKRHMVELLLRHGAKPGLPDDPPWATPLAWATRRGHTEIVRLLTEYEQTGKLPRHKLAEYEALARDFIAVFAADNTEALQRIQDHFQRRRMPRLEEFRNDVRKRLGARQPVESAHAVLSLADAQYLVAQMHGYESWEELAQGCES